MMDLLSLTVSMGMQSEMKELRNETGKFKNTVTCVTSMATSTDQNRM